jgi:hypothetical protein
MPLKKRMTYVGKGHIDQEHLGEFRVRAVANLALNASIA